MVMKKLADEFLGVYPVSKTLRFEIKPIGRTREYIERDGILNTDIHRSESYKKVKKIIDRYHKQFIDEALSDAKLNGLDRYYELYTKSRRDDKEEKEFAEVQKTLRKQIAALFKRHPKFAILFKKELIKEELLEYVKANAEEDKMVKEFENFTTYFSGFFKNRKNMYSDEEKSTAIAYRIVHQNLPKYIDNMRIYEHMRDIAPKLCSEISNKLDRDLQLTDIKVYFSLGGFNYTLTQKGITAYNNILGGYSRQDGTKVQGVNEYINLHNQEYKDKKAQLPIMKALFKQILSDRGSVSFIPEKYNSDDELLESVNDLYEYLRQEVFDGSDDNVSVRDLLKRISSFNLYGIYVKSDTSLTAISNAVFGDWSYINNAIREAYDIVNDPKGNKRNTAKYADKREKALAKAKNYSIGELNEYITQKETGKPGVESYFAEEGEKCCLEIEEAYKKYEDFFNNKFGGYGSLRRCDEGIGVIKKLLDGLKKLQWVIKPLINVQNESDKDEFFYVNLLRIWEILDEVTPLYNKVRNYVTQKPYSLEKVKLNFDKVTLLDGWDVNEEKDNLGIILIKDGLYYLGIMRRDCNRIMQDAPEASGDNVYRKMEYKLISKARRDFPHVFLAKCNAGQFKPSAELLECYKKGTHKKGDNFSLSDCHRLIDFFKDSINRHEDWSQFGFKFSDTKEYKDISDFYREVNQLSYKISFRNIDTSYIDSLVESGKLYLFQIYNKDFSKYSKGTPNMHTLYWKMLFDPENLRNIVYKLNGEAEVFYREKSIGEKDIVTHEPNVPIANRQGGISVFEYELIKDKRYTVDKFQFHVSVTLNYNATGDNYMNRRLNGLIHDWNGMPMHIIGIDRGERNLLYICVVDMQGNIKKQLSLNEIISASKKGDKHVVDYHDLLERREKDNRSARENWQTINTIKELKEGYLSQVIHTIAELMIEYNAIVVLEDLNSRFKRGRQKFEKQIYQKFEKMLIDKLNYLVVDKNMNPLENGGLLKAYQLTNKFESFKKLGKQSGFLYYVPAWNTSKIDPSTGFVNLFYTKYESVEKTVEFIKKFDFIRYSRDEQYFEFEFDYSNFTYKAEGSCTHWRLCSHGVRIESFRDAANNNEWNTRTLDLTEEFKKLFEKYGVALNEDNMQAAMCDINDAGFYRNFMKLFALMLQLRNSDKEKDEIVSPVKNAKGEFFCTGKASEEPLDADANGAYNIARKGVWIIEQIQMTDKEGLDKLKLAISNKDWLAYAQRHTI